MNILLERGCFVCAGTRRVKVYWQADGVGWSICYKKKCEQAYKSFAAMRGNGRRIR